MTDYSGIYQHSSPVFGSMILIRGDDYQGHHYLLSYHYRGSKITDIPYSTESVRKAISSGLWTLVYPKAMGYPDGI